MSRFLLRFYSTRCASFELTDSQPYCFFQDVLQQLVVMDLPDVLAVVHEPNKGTSECLVLCACCV